MCGEQPGGEPEDRAEVDRLRRARRAPRPLVAPAGELAEDRHQLARALGQLVVHPGRNLAVALTGEHAVGDHAVESRAQLLGRDAREHPLQLDEPSRSGGQVANDEQRPFVADQVERPSVGRPLVIRVAFRWGYVRNWELPPGGRSYLPSSSLTDVRASSAGPVGALYGLHTEGPCSMSAPGGVPRCAGRVPRWGRRRWAVAVLVCVLTIAPRRAPAPHALRQFWRSELVAVSDG